MRERCAPSAGVACADLTQVTEQAGGPLLAGLGALPGEFSKEAMGLPTDAFSLPGLFHLRQNVQTWALWGVDGILYRSHFITLLGGKAKVSFWLFSRPHAGMCPVWGQFSGTECPFLVQLEQNHGGRC